MLVHRIIRSARAGLPFWLMGLLIAEGVLALCSMFIFPPLALLMVFVGIATIGVFLVTRTGLARSDDALTRWRARHEPDDS